MRCSPTCTQLPRCRNAVEVVESLEVLAGGGPDDVVELTLALACEMCDAAGLDEVDPAQTLRDGSAMNRSGTLRYRAGRTSHGLVA